MLWDIGETDLGECVFVFVLWKASKNFNLHVFVELINVTNHRHICWFYEHLWLAIAFKLVRIHSPLNARFFSSTLAMMLQCQIFE